MTLRTIFLAHAEADHEFAGRLTEFLEFGCNIFCDTDEGLVLPDEDFIAKAENGLAADALVLLLSEASCPTRWLRERWEPVLFAKTRLGRVELVTVLLRDCPFPALLQRRNFFDARTNRLAAMRWLKRWIWQRDRGPSQTVNRTFSADLEDLYSHLADKAGTLETSGAPASRFAREAVQEFEAVFWVPCQGRSLAQIAGELGSQLGLRLEGTTEQNCRKIQDMLFYRRCLLVLDAPNSEHVAALVPDGRTSTLLTLDPVSVVKAPESLAYARTLISSRRYAEAYELLYCLLGGGVAPETCARELTWICEQWDRIEEANSLRFRYGQEPYEQLALF
jgi:hypothetical protein